MKKWGDIVFASIIIMIALVLASLNVLRGTEGANKITIIILFWGGIAYLVSSIIRHKKKK